MNSNDFYLSTLKALENSSSDFRDAQLALQQAQNIFAGAEREHLEATAKATDYYASKLRHQQTVIANVIRKHNHGRLRADHVTLPSLDWVFTYGTLEIVRLSKNTITFRLCQGNGNYSPETTVGRGTLSTSTWDLAKTVRARLWEKSNTLASEKLAEEERKLRARRLSIQRRLASDQKELARLEKQIESHHKVLAKV